MYRVCSKLLKQGLWLMLCMISVADAATTEDHIVAVVNDVPITARQLDVQTKVMLERRQEQSKLANPQVTSQIQQDPVLIKKQILQQMIDQTLQSQIALAEGIQVEDADVDRAVQVMAHRDHISVQELKSKIEKVGMSDAEFRKQLRNEIAINRLHQKQIAAEVNVTDQEIANYLTTLNSVNNTSYEYKVMDYRIDLPKSKAAMNRTKQVAASIYQQLQVKKTKPEEGATKLLASVPVSTQDLGWRRVEEFPDVFSTMVASMHVGDVKGPIAAANGFHVIQLVEKRAVTAPQTTLAELSMDKKINSELRELIFKQKFEQNLYQWLSLQRDHAHIKVLDKELG